MSGAAIMKVLLYAMVPLRGLSSFIAAPRVGGGKVEWDGNELVPDLVKTVESVETTVVFPTVCH